nr:TrmH family RNA methyltransferase [Euzebya rosea]
MADHVGRDAAAGQIALDDGEVVGAFHVRIDTATHAGRGSITVSGPARRHGIAGHVAPRLVSLALTAQADGGLGLRRVQAAAAGSNTAATALARRLGVKRETRARQDRWTEGLGIDDTLAWGVLADEWDCETHRMRGADPEHEVGVGPHPEPRPTDDRYDPALLAGGDRRNVADRYRYWTVEAIRADLAATARPFHVAIENWRHDLNIGTVVRTANAFGAGGVHIVGKRQWNKRGAMVTDRYLEVHHHDRFEGLRRYAADHDLTLIGIDNLPGSRSLLTEPLPERCLMVFGQEGPGLSPEARIHVEAVLHIPQVGSTRSINAGVASGIAMATWAAQHSATDRSG